MHYRTDIAGLRAVAVLPRLLARSLARGGLLVARGGRDMSRIALDRAMATQVRAAGATYVSMQALECGGGDCPLFAPDGGPFHFDYGHLTLSASRVLVGRVPAKALEPAPQ